jgi:hypothetical protein
LDKPGLRFGTAPADTWSIMTVNSSETASNRRRNQLLYVALLAAWLLICLWQRAEHARYVERLREGMAARAKVMSSSMEIMLRAMRSFGGIVTVARLQVYLDELVASQDLTGVLLVNAAHGVVARSGASEDVDLGALVGRKTVWKNRQACFYFPVDLGVSTHGDTSRQRQAIVLPPPE